MNTNSSDHRITNHMHHPNDETGSSSDESDFSKFFNEAIKSKRKAAPPSDSDSDESSTDSEKIRQQLDGNDSINESDLNTPTHKASNSNGKKTTNIHNTRQQNDETESEHEPDFNMKQITNEHVTSKRRTKAPPPSDSDSADSSSINGNNRHQTDGNDSTPETALNTTKPKASKNHGTAMTNFRNTRQHNDETDSNSEPDFNTKQTHNANEIDTSDDEVVTIAASKTQQLRPDNINVHRTTPTTPRQHNDEDESSNSIDFDFNNTNTTRDNTKIRIENFRCDDDDDGANGDGDGDDNTDDNGNETARDDDDDNTASGKNQAQPHYNTSIHNDATNAQQQSSREWRQFFNNIRHNIPRQLGTQQQHHSNTLQTIISPANKKDNKPIGDTLNNDEVSNTFRIYFQNINGVTAGKGTGKWDNILQTMVKKNVSIFGLAETNIEWNNHKLSSRLKAKVRRTCQHANIATSTSSIQSATAYKPGGTSTIAIKQWTGRITDQIKDTTSQGRWSGLKLRAPRPIAIITAYRVTQNSIDQAGHKTAYAQQWAVARIQGEEQPEPRKQFITDLQREIKKLQTDHDIILMLDANEQIIEGKNHGISHLAASCNLCDIIATKHPETKTTATYARGTKRIDFILISTTLVSKVKESGLLAFYDGIESDHRGMYVDFDTTLLFQDSTPHLYTQPSRKLSSKMPKAVNTYKTSLWKQLEAHNIPNRSKQIEMSADTTRTNDAPFILELNKIANTIQAAMLKAELDCNTIPAAPYSDQLANLNKVIRFWKIYKSGIKTKRDVSEQLRQIRESLPSKLQPHTIKTSTIEKHLRMAITAYNNAIPDAKKLRQEQIYEWAEAAAKRGDKTIAQHFKSMAHAEESRDTFRILQSVIKPQDKSGIKQIDIPATDANGATIIDEAGQTVMTTISDPATIEKMIIERNKKHFSQAHETPFTSKAITDIFGNDGESQATDDLIQGHLPHNIHNLPTTVQTILRKIAQRPPDEMINMEIDTDQLTAMFKKWKERTSTSPSGCHLGHWRALWAPDGIERRHDTSMADIGPSIMTIHNNILNASVRSGVPLDRWKTVHSNMIAKNEGKARIDKLRVIHLYEADYNGFLKITWPHRAVHNATKKRTLNYAQGGGQKGRQANHIALQKEMKYQYARLRKTNLATMDNDAKACYDRIIMLLATITSGHYGIPKAARDLQAKAIRQMQFRIKTALGISQDYYEDSNNEPLHGSGQGSGSSGPIWLFISSIIMDCFEDIASGMTMTNIDATTTTKQWIDGFVDDTSIFTNADSNNPTELATILQNDAIEWNKLLSATGGKLELTKCFYYILHWQFDDEGIATPTSKEELEKLGVKILIKENEDDEPTEIRHLDCDTAHRTLGLYKSITGNQTMQIQRLKERSENISQSVASSSITRSQATTAWNSIYIPSIAYPLVATYIDEDSLNKIESRALMAFLPKMGYNRNTARAVIYGPEEYGGLGIKNLYVEQSIEQIKAFMQHTRLDSPLGKTMLINLDWAQLIAGIQKPIFEDTRHLPHMEGEWFQSIRHFLHATFGQLKTDNIWTPQPEREHDMCIMDLIDNSSATAMQCINRCRIFLQATTISDITNAEGDRINDYAWNNNPNIMNPRRSKHAWPIQPRPGKKSWRAWKAALQQYLSANGKGQKLRQPLGQWLIQQTASRQEWNWYHDQQNNQLISNDHTTIRAYNILDSRTRQYKYNPDNPTILTTIPDTAIPTTVHNFTTTTRSTAATSTTPTNINTNDTTDTTFSTYVKSLDPWEYHLFSEAPLHHHMSISTAITTDNNITIVSDGGMKNGYGSFGWIMETNTGTITGRGEAQGARELMQSFRAEGYGMLAALRYLYHACKYATTWPHEKKKITIYCDNKSLIQRIRWHKKRTTVTPKNTSAPDYDLEISITNTIDELAKHNIIIKEQHVKGHQDKHTQYHQLPREAQLNIEADIEATIALDNHTTNNNYTQPPAVRTMLYNYGQPTTSKEAITLRRAYLSHDLRHHMIHRENWEQHVPDTICWEAHKRALKKLQNVDKTRIQKFIHRCLPTNKKLHDIDHDHTNICPSCNCIETNDHVSSCNNPRRTKIKNTMRHNLNKILDKTGTHHHIKECFLIGLDRALNDDNTPIQQHELSFSADPDITAAIDEQEKIGWINFYRGRISQKWNVTQDNHNKNNPNTSNHDIFQWATKIVTTMWHGFLLLWEERKQDQHGRDKIQQTATLRQNLLKRTRQLYSKIHLYDNEDKRFFTTTLEQWEQATNNAIQDWITIAEPIAEKSQSRAKTRTNKNQPTITQFFGAIIHEPITQHANTHNRRPPRKQTSGK